MKTWSQSPAAASERREELAQQRELTSTDIASWGYHLEAVIDHDHSQDSGGENAFPIGESMLGQGIAKACMAARSASIDDLVNVVSQGMEWWAIGDWESIRVTASQPSSASEAIQSTPPAALVEYLAYRRGVVSFIRRSVLRCSIQRRSLSRRKIGQWTLLLTSVTDDFVLAGWQLGQLRRWRSACEQSNCVGDLEEAELQVRRNIESLAQRMDSEQGRVAIVLTVLFGTMAFASLLPVISFVFAWSTGMPSEAAVLAHPRPFAFIAATLLVVILATSFLLLRGAVRLRRSRKRVTL